MADRLSPFAKKPELVSVEDSDSIFAPEVDPTPEGSIFDEERGGAIKFPDAELVRLENPGDSVEGKVVDMSKRISGQYGESKAYTLQRKDGSYVTYWASYKVSQRTGKEYGVGASLERFDAEIGDYIGVKFLGWGDDEAPFRTGSAYKNEDVRVKKAKK